MSNYAESKKKFDEIRNKVGEMMFRMSISHLMDVGIRHLTEETVEETCKGIMKTDDTNHFMTNEFKCSIVRNAYELAKIPHTDLLVYVQREVVYDVFDGVPSYERAIHLLKACMNWIESDDSGETLDNFEFIGFEEDEIEALGWGYMLEAREEEDD
jgi:hypothetical protein